MGYRHIDAAEFYANEDLIGEVLHEAISSGRVQAKPNTGLVQGPCGGLHYAPTSTPSRPALVSIRTPHPAPRPNQRPAPPSSHTQTNALPMPRIS